MQPVKRFGALVPFANVTVEDEFRRYVPDDVQYHVARLYRKSLETNADSLRDMIGSTEKAAREIAGVRPEVVVWACTSGSFLEGHGHDKDIAELITRVSQVPSITTSTAVIDALHAVNARKVYMITPYIKALNDQEEKFLRLNGFEVLHTASFLYTNTIDIRNTTSQQVVSLIERNCEHAGDFDAVFISCTQLHSMDQIGMLEDRLGVPVVTSNQATLWAALRAIGSDLARVPAGRLFTRSGSTIAMAAQ